MGQVLHGSATTTEAVRRAIQHSQESLRSLARRHGIDPKTVAKWRKRKSTADLPTGPKDPRSTSLSMEEEAVVTVAVLQPGQAAPAPIEGVLIVSMRQEPQDALWAARFAGAHRFIQSGRIGAAHGVSPDPPAEPHVQLSPHAALHCDEPSLCRRSGRRPL